MIVSILSGILTLVFFFLGGIHLFWVLGGEWGFNASLPTDENGERVLNPAKVGTTIVAMGLLTFGIIYLEKSGLINFEEFEHILIYVRWVIPFIFILRAIGEFRYVGFFKKIKQTQFGKTDTKLFSPLCLIIGIFGILIQLG